MYTLLLVSLLGIGQQSGNSREAIVANTLSSQLPNATKNLVTETEIGYDALLATMIAAMEGRTLPADTISALCKLSDSPKNGFKELYATEILLEAGHPVSEIAFRRAVRMATGELKDRPFSLEKRLLAVKVLQTYKNRATKVQ